MMCMYSYSIICILVRMSDAIGGASSEWRKSMKPGLEETLKQVHYIQITLVHECKRS